MNKDVVITIIVVLVIIGVIAICANSQLTGGIGKSRIEIKTNKDAVYGLFNDFPESNNIYYTSKNLYSERSIGPTIYQIDILAELTDEAYNKFISQVQFGEIGDFEVKVNPNNVEYNWKSIKNTSIIKSKNNEDASIRNIYVDENTKTIYVIAVGGN